MYFGIGSSALILYAASALTHEVAARVPALGIPIATFLLSQIFVRGARYTSDQLICPKNWMLLLFAMQLLAIPVIVLITGFADGVLRTFRPTAPFTGAVFLQPASLVSCMSGFILALRWRGSSPRPSATLLRSAPMEQNPPPPRAIIALAAVAWIVGLSALPIPLRPRGVLRFPASIPSWTPG